MGIGFLNRKHGSLLKRGLLVLGILLAGLLSNSPRLAVAQDEEPAALPPLVVVNAAGVDRLLGDVNYMFKTIGREDLSDVVNGFLANVGDLKGLDRKKSMGRSPAAIGRRRRRRRYSRRRFHE
jgi:hypothetical protein